MNYRQDLAAKVEAEMLLKTFPQTGPISQIKVAEFPKLSNAVRAWLKHDRPLDYRSPGIHPSGLGRWCLREQVFKAIAVKCKDKVPLIRTEPSLQLIFEAGHATHNWWQSRLLGAMGILWGKWRCNDCGHVHGTSQDIVNMPKQCASCGAHRYYIWFEEENIVIPAHIVLGCKEEDLTEMDQALFRIVGHCDGEIRLPTGERYVAELKSQNKFSHPGRVEPDKAHNMQGLVYSHAKGVDGVMVIYVNKDTYALKTYLVTGEEPVIKWVFDEVRKVKRFADQKSVEGIPRVCSGKNCDRAKSCPFREVCF